MATPHINAQAEDFSETVIMAGDPLRVKFIAANYLERAEEITNVRAMYGYTGYYKGSKLSVMGHGMGVPSCSIYVTELIQFYGVKNILRLGSAGGVLPDVKLGDIIIAMGASTDSNCNRIRFNNADFAAIANYELLNTAVNTAKNIEIPIKTGNIFTTDLFYNSDLTMVSYMEKYGILCVEMETAGIYAVAAELGAKALTICTISDHLKTEDSMSSEQRQLGFNQMIKLGLETAILI